MGKFGGAASFSNAEIAEMGREGEGEEQNPCRLGRRYRERS